MKKLNLTWKEEAIIGGSRLTRHTVGLPLVGRISLENKGSGWRLRFLDNAGMLIDLESVSIQEAKKEALQRILGICQQATKSLEATLVDA